MDFSTHGLQQSTQQQQQQRPFSTPQPGRPQTSQSNPFLQQFPSGLNQTAGQPGIYNRNEPHPSPPAIQPSGQPRPPTTGTLGRGNPYGR